MASRSPSPQPRKKAEGVETRGRRDSSPTSLRSDAESSQRRREEGGGDLATSARDQHASARDEPNTRSESSRHSKSHHHSHSRRHSESRKHSSRRSRSRSKSPARKHRRSSRSPQHDEEERYGKSRSKSRSLSPAHVGRRPHSKSSPSRSPSRRKRERRSRSKSNSPSRHRREQHLQRSRSRSPPPSGRRGHYRQHGWHGGYHRGRGGGGYHKRDRTSTPVVSSTPTVGKDSSTHQQPSFTPQLVHMEPDPNAEKLTPEQKLERALSAAQAVRNKIPQPSNSPLLSNPPTAPTAAPQSVVAPLAKAPAALTQKKKLVWGKKGSSANQWEGVSLGEEGDNSDAQAKFRRLMGMGKNTAPSSDTQSESKQAAGTGSSEMKEKHEKLRKDLEQQYEASRYMTHLARGSGLGFGFSSQT